MTEFSFRTSFVVMVIAIILFCNQNVFSSDKKDGHDKLETKNHYELIQDLKMQEESGFFDVDFTPRRTKALIFSAFVPGSGQTYLGDELKGMAISLSFYGTALAAIIANNNAKGREDRLKVLTQEYKSKGNYNDAEKVWQSILGEKELRDNDYDRREVFTWIAAGVWIYNIIDVIFLTNDFGEDEFSIENQPFELNLLARNDYNGVAIKINLP